MSRASGWAAALLALAIAGQVAAQEASNADSWGLASEQPARLAGQVVDVLCELSGDCPADCGGGARQLGILRDDGSLVLVAKNGQFLFTGAVQELLPHCRARVEADGLMVGAPVRFYAVQKLRRPGETEWREADRWTAVWAEKNPAHRDAVEEWYRHDQRVVREIGRSGYLGLGPAADIPFIRSQ